MGASSAGTVALCGVVSAPLATAKVVTVVSTSISLDSTSGREAATADDGGVGARTRTTRGGGDMAIIWVPAEEAESGTEASAATAAAAPAAGSETMTPLIGQA